MVESRCAHRFPADVESAQAPVDGALRSRRRASPRRRAACVNRKLLFHGNGRFLRYRGIASFTVRAHEAQPLQPDAQMEIAHFARVTSLGQLTASIAHEVNQPLAAILANASAALRWLEGQALDVVSICRSIIDRLGGQLSARANTPRGTIFEFSIPR